MIPDQSLDNAPRLSIVVPAHNAARSLAACLRSVTPGAAEVIVVDEGAYDAYASATFAWCWLAYRWSRRPATS